MLMCFVENLLSKKNELFEREWNIIIIFGKSYYLKLMCTNINTLNKVFWCLIIDNFYYRWDFVLQRAGKRAWQSTLLVSTNLFCCMLFSYVFFFNLFNICFENFNLNEWNYNWYIFFEWTQHSILVRKWHSMAREVKALKRVLHARPVKVSEGKCYYEPHK